MKVSLPTCALAFVIKSTLKVEALKVESKVWVLPLMVRVKVKSTNFEPELVLAMARIPIFMGVPTVTVVFW
jgi:hypothetical protein